MTTRSSEAIYIILAGLVSAVALLLNLPPVLKLLFGILLIFVLPGYAVTLALFTPVTPGIFERICLTLGSSLAIVVLSGFLLHLLGAGLQFETWLLFLSMITASGGGIAYFRSGVHQNEKRQSLSITMEQAMLLSCAFALILSSILLSRANETQFQHGASSFTQLWYQCAAVENGEVLIISLRSSEETDMNYRLVLSNGDQILEEWDGIHLKPGQQWDAAVTLPAAGETQELEAKLYRSGGPLQVYRRLSIHQQETGICR